MLKDIVCKDGLYLLKYPNYFIGDDYEKIIILVKEILKNKPFIDIKSGLCIFDVYFNDYYGIVFEIKYNFLKHYNIPLKVVAMKVDKVTKNNRDKNVKQIIKVLNIQDENELILFSSITKVGKQEVYNELDKLLINNVN